MNHVFVFPVHRVRWLVLGPFSLACRTLCLIRTSIWRQLCDCFDCQTPRVVRTVLALTLVISPACDVEHQSSVTQPSTLTSLVGTWRTSSAIGTVPQPDQCTSWDLRITDQQGTTARGTLTATCRGIAVNGTFNATLDGINVVFTATGTAAAAGVPSCPFTLSGTGVVEGAALRVNYTGTTCVGPISGTELLRQ